MKAEIHLTLPDSYRTLLEGLSTTDRDAIYLALNVVGIIDLVLMLAG